MKRSQVLIFAATLAICIGCDHATKRIAGSALGGETISFVGDSVRLELAQNAGAFLGVGSDLPQGLRSLLLLLLVPLGLGLVCVLAVRSGIGTRAALLGLGLVAGGGLANWLDRLTHQGLVTDFVSLGLGPLRTGIFNLADVCIVVGAILLLVRSERPEANAAQLSE